jgi:hypothetical protein
MLPDFDRADRIGAEQATKADALVDETLVEHRNDCGPALRKATSDATYRPNVRLTCSLRTNTVLILSL